MNSVALGLTVLLLVTLIIISYKEGLHIIKDSTVMTLCTVVQLIILGFLLHCIFKINDKWLLVLCVFATIVSASQNTISQSPPITYRIFLISFAVIFVGTTLPLVDTIATGAIRFTANGVVPIGSMLANNGLIAVNLAYQNLDRALVQDGTNIKSELSLTAAAKLASKGTVREGIRLAITPTIDSVRTYGFVSIPGMMTGLIIGGIPFLQAIKFQLLVAFTHTAAITMSALITVYLSYGQFSNVRHQSVARNTDIKNES